MNKSLFYNSFQDHFPHTPTADQEYAMKRLTGFLFYQPNDALFVLRGFAGTGKTTIIGSLVKTLFALKRKAVLMAPTGRAAKVLSGYSGRKAFTIHKLIYRFVLDTGGNFQMILAPNKLKDGVFLVDEASMINAMGMDAGPGFFGQRNLLEDLLTYVHEGDNCKLILIGDTAQLPPVGYDTSPALDLRYMKDQFGLNIFFAELKQVVRQAKDSGILSNATTIRKNLDSKGFSIQINTTTGDDVIPINGEMLEEHLNNAFMNGPKADAVVVTRSNKRANIFNSEVRNRILFRVDELAAGDQLMVVKNNYYWLDPKTKAGFIANGDIIEIMRLGKSYDLYNHKFRDATVRLIDYPEEAEIEVKLMLSTLMHNGPSLSQEEMREFYKEVMQDYMDEPRKQIRNELVKKNPYYNALQIKFSYALTCHKTQGGQWDDVFIDLGYVNEDHLDKSFYRWLYTAFTRAKKRVYLVNFPKEFLP